MSTRTSSPTPSDSSLCWDGIVTLRVSFPQLVVCKNCKAYEDIFFNTSTATIRQVKADIATQLGIETDEFVFDSKYDNKENRHKVDMLFAEKYLPSNYEPDVDINGDWVPFELSLFKNEKYKGTTGILSWIIDQKKDLYCTEYYYGGGQLAHGFAKNVAAFKVQYNVKTISSVPSLVGDAAKK